MSLRRRMKFCAYFHGTIKNLEKRNPFPRPFLLLWLEKNPRFLQAFKALGLVWDLMPAIYEALEEYACHLYGSKKRKVNEVRHQMFRRKYDNENKIVDLSSLPPCQSVLNLHTSRANFVAKVWKSAGVHQLEFPNLSAHGWTEMCEII